MTNEFYTFNAGIFWLSRGNYLVLVSLFCRPIFRSIFHLLIFFVQSFLKIGRNVKKKKKIKMWLQKDFDHKPYSTITPDPNFSCALLGIVAKRRALCFDIAIFCPVSQSIIINIGVKRHCASISWATFAILSFS